MKKRRQRTKAERETDAKRTGRPPCVPGHRRTAFVGVHMTPAERRKLEAEAKRLGVSLSALLMRPWRKGD